MATFFVLPLGYRFCLFGRIADYKAELRRIFDEELGDYAERVVQLLAATI
ncbi:hypothetical protein [Hymenobacter setariae]|nr:hypothetical protein [Hymenobacter setariae]